MKIRKVDAENDWRFGKGLQDYAANESAIAQNIQSRIFSWIGDCFFALNEGIDWKNRLDFSEEQNLINEIKTILIQSFGVINIIDFSFLYDRNSRKISILYNIQTIFSSSFQTSISAVVGV